jgi:hypothetical protein
MSAKQLMAAADTGAATLLFLRINTGPFGYGYLSLRKYRQADMPTLAQQAEIRSM